MAIPRPAPIVPLEQPRQEQTRPDTVSVTSSSLPRTPSVRVIGCGGCGINIVSSLLTNPIYPSGSEPYQFNVAGMDTNDEALYRGIIYDFVELGDGRGGGLNRASIVDNVRARLLKMDSDQLFLAEFNIIVASASGASGSTIAPLLAAEIKRRGFRCAIVLVADLSAGLLVSNTEGALRSLDAAAKNNGIYLPVAIFTNQDGRAAADAGVRDAIRGLYEVMALPTYELDVRDRLHFVDGGYINNVAPGVRQIHVGDPMTALPGEIWVHNPDVINDGVIYTGNDAIGNDAMPPARFLKRGPYAGPEASMVGNTMIVITGDSSGFTTLMGDVTASKRQLSAVGTTSLSFADHPGGSSDGDIVL